jgi:ribosome-binding factor A
MGEARAKQLADRIQVLVAELLERRVKDPRLGFVTVTDARLTGDLREASVFYTVYGDEQARANTAAALESSNGLIRSEVGKALGLRHTPSVAFFLDAVPETAGHIEELLQKARSADAEVAKAAAGAKPAGDADPYKHKDDDEDEQD